MVDLSGSWLGTYWQDGIPTRFELTLVQGGNTITGNILDDSYLGEASLVGEVIGRKISFIKQYLIGSHEGIHYMGTVSEDETFMQGQWQIISLSGTWEAYRNNDNLTLSLETLSTQKVPVAAVN